MVYCIYVMYLKCGIIFNLSNIKIILFFEIILNFMFYFLLLIKYRSFKLKCLCMIVKIYMMFIYWFLIFSYIFKIMVSFYVVVMVFIIRWINLGIFFFEVVRCRIIYVYSWCSVVILKCIYFIGKVICYIFIMK